MHLCTVLDRTHEIDRCVTTSSSVVNTHTKKPRKIHTEGDEMLSGLRTMMMAVCCSKRTRSLTGKMYIPCSFPVTFPSISCRSWCAYFETNKNVIGTKKQPSNLCTVKVSETEFCGDGGPFDSFETLPHLYIHQVQSVRKLDSPNVLDWTKTVHGLPNCLFVPITLLVYIFIAKIFKNERPEGI